jgi:regulator of sirC expression with transglutaminase-like and TPR domain
MTQSPPDPAHRTERFAALLARPDWTLVDACLDVAGDAYPALDHAPYVAALETMAVTVRGRLAADAFAEQRIAALNHHFFTELGFHGTTGAWDDPRSSYLNDVIERRSGIPIALSILYMDVGRRIGLPVDGISFPGHFLVGVRVRRGQLVLDPFAGGAPVGEGELRTRLAQAIGAARAANEPIAPWIAAAAPRDVIARVLRNLKAIHVRAGDAERALAVMDRLVVTLPAAAEERRDRGLLYRQLDCFRPALADLQAYLAARPRADDAAEMHALAVELGRMAGRLN